MSHRTSIVIISRNENPNMLAATIEGLLATTVGRWREIIVIDDASREPVAISAPEVVTFRNPEAVGASRARKLGAEMASGDVLVWLDAHMSFGSDWLDAFLAEVDSGALLCGAWRNYDRQRIHGWGSDFAWRERRDHACGFRPGFDFAPRLRPPRGRAGPVPMVVGGCYVMAQESYERVGGFCPLFRTYGGEEADLSARIWLSGGSVRCVTRAEVGHFDRVRFPYPVEFDHIEFNQIVMIRSIFEQSTAALLEEYFTPLSEKVTQWLADTNIEAWRAQIQTQRLISDADLLRRIAPRVPISFNGAPHHRRGHRPAWRIQAALEAEKAAYAPLAWTDESLASVPARTLIRGCAVGWSGRGILLPGSAENGLQALMRELISQDAIPYGNGVILLGQDGSLNADPRIGLDCMDRPPLRPGVVAAIDFTGGRSWKLRPVTEAEAAMDLLAASPDQRSAELFAAVNRAVDGIVALHGSRGPPRAMARALLAAML